MSDKMLEEFEVWFQSAFNFETASMRFAMREVMFEAWQASRAALCVELPMEYKDQFNEPSYSAPAVRNAIASSGVRYK